jgi:hypothetical protein
LSRLASDSLAVVAAPSGAAELLCEHHWPQARVNVLEAIEVGIEMGGRPTAVHARSALHVMTTGAFPVSA